MHIAWLILLLPLQADRCFAEQLNAVDALFQWIRDLGGEVHAEVRVNSAGVRGLFATKAIGENEYIASIPGTAILNAGAVTDSFAVPTLAVLREMKNPHSRFKPYMDTWPMPHEVVNACNFDPKYLKLFKSPHWEKNVAEWQEHISLLHQGRLDGALEFTIKEMVGNATITPEDLRYACAVSSSRYVVTAQRKRLLMVPVFDFTNHARSCPHALTSYDTGDFIHFVAGEAIQPGQEICYSYGNLRDDYAVANYGFLPEPEDPPRLALVDHRDHRPEATYSHEGAPSDEPFEGGREAMREELRRLQAAHGALAATPDPLPPPPDGAADYVYDMMKELERRRLEAMQYEITRLSFALNDKTEL